MNRMVVEKQVNEEGLLQLIVSLGKEEAGRDVRVTIEPLDSRKTMTLEEWKAGILAMAGRWEGDFECQPL